MFGTFNLQLTSTLSTEGLAESSIGTGLSSTGLAAEPVTDFAALLQTRSDIPLDATAPHGDFLPQGGKELPQPTPLPVDPQADPLIATAAEPAEPEDLIIHAMWPDAVSKEPLENKPTAAQSLIPTDTKAPRAPVATAAPGRTPDIDLKLANAVTLPASEAAKPAAPAVAQPLLSTPPQPSANRLDATRTRFPVSAESADIVAPQRSTLASQSIGPEFEAVPRIATTVDANPIGERALAAVNNNASSLPQFAQQLQTAFSRDVALPPGATPDLVRTPVGEPAWGDRIGERVLMMAGNLTQQADIRLTPADLGPLRVRIAVEEGAANITFQSQHAVTREAIEAAMPRLREMLAENGLSLGQTSVGGDGVAEQRERRDTEASSQSAGSEQEVTDEPVAERQKAVSSDGLVDTFA